jgi:aryl-alcohol dehydrogenase-like predicted oxidoreductase
VRVIAADHKEAAVQQRTLGDRQVSAIGLGAMPLSVDDRPPRARALRTVHAALDAGVTLIDTADAYCTDASDVGHNEQLVAEAVSTWGGNRDGLVIATKGGHVRGGDGSWLLNGRPDYLRQACEASLRALGVDCIDLYQLHRPDPEVPVSDSVSALAQLQAEGKVRMIGVSNFSVEQLRAVDEVADVVSVQNEYSPAFRSSAGEADYCAKEGIAFLAWSPLGGMGAAGALGRRFPAFAEISAERGVSPQQVALAWILAAAPNTIPIPGSSRPETILDSVAAADLVLDDGELQRLADT